MYKHILVPLERSNLSESVLPYVRRLARDFNVPVELLHVIDPEIIDAARQPGGRARGSVERSIKENALRYLTRIAASFPRGAEITSALEIGKTAEVILGHAAARPATLVAMATHGRSGIERWLLGSVASSVLAATTNPLLLVRPAENFDVSGIASLARLLVPLDGSALAEKVLPHVEALSGTLNLDVVLLRVYRVMEAAYIADEYRFDLDLRKKKIKADAQKYLERKVRQLRNKGARRVSSLLAEGDAAGEIIAHARAVPETLIVMCTHGRTGLARWMLGSVADRVVRNSGDPVLLIRA
ncbi:MAG TPA: universal stress protein [Candidatus Acidoferrales bacterium]|nr:universal stress protein [Candidatus Acidoferrales bacterium]